MVFWLSIFVLEPFVVPGFGDSRYAAEQDWRPIELADEPVFLMRL